MTLGLLAGVLEFVPFAGPIIAAVPAILLALAVSPDLALWVLLLYLAVQQFEGYVLTPLGAAICGRPSGRRAALLADRVSARCSARWA